MLVKNKKVLVYGMSQSGIWVTKLLKKKHAKVYIYDDNRDQVRKNYRDCYLLPETHAPGGVLLPDIQYGAAQRVFRHVVVAAHHMGGVEQLGAEGLHVPEPSAQFFGGVLHGGVLSVG